MSSALCWEVRQRGCCRRDWLSGAVVCGQRDRAAQLGETANSKREKDWLWGATVAEQYRAEPQTNRKPEPWREHRAPERERASNSANASLRRQYMWLAKPLS